MRTLYLRELTETKATIEAPPSRLAYASDHVQHLATLVSAALGRPMKVAVEPMPEDRVIGPITDPGAAPGGPQAAQATSTQGGIENDPEDHPLVQAVIKVFDARVLRKERHNSPAPNKDSTT
ncbi:MAG: hypothetical protein AAGI53_05210 [Planctomycetota bacterium]